MILSLGHPYLDGLTNQLFFKRWDTLPQDVCAKIKELGGDLDEPWQIFEIQKMTHLAHAVGGFEEQP
jgi:hypothetical protein